jgi:DNA-binding transcriptional LysR family regulator
VRFAADTGELAVRAAAAGLGITVTPTFLASDAVRCGELLAIELPGARLVADDLCVVRPAQRQTPRRVRALVDHLAAAFTDPPAWDTPFGIVAE